MRTATAALVLVALTATGCARAGSTGFPPPARPGVLVAADAEQTFATLHAMLETRGLPILVSDASFGNLITEWVDWAPGEVNLGALAECGLDDDDRVTHARGRFAFEVRPRANRAQVTVLAHYQVERHPGFDESDRGYVDCRSTGEWERVVGDALTQRQVVR
ncbi:MAG: hypothetical protein RJQ04_07655 [Longimicrobiales bacterium]